ncbi:hypothetical protein OIU78_021972 [Salix suchowensis]|nr:hypothetical protein OIU78_021972 [Salix suchowensis]
MAGSLDSLLSKCTTLSLPHTKQLHAHLFTTGQFQLPISPSRSKLLELYALSLGNLSFAILAFSQIRNPSTNDWNAIIRGFIQSPNPTNAFAWYKSMISKSRKVDALTCSFVLKACARVLARLESIQIHTHIVRKGFIADALLGTTLLDLYAKFYNADKSHESWREIYAKLDEIRFRVKEYGYVAETSFVLHDIGEEDKENVLGHHSEKLAVAFGLVSTREGTPIQVIKNLRICGDCHFVIKLISKIYDREIIVRDRVRFHRFIEGTCSCRDYW